ncbi:MFS transporter [Paenisporosarcina sp. TG20]|uniref:MFS transporter n=1 Tax=Paenisporosarcina sp. TG20 TaxID=1211706 RepID=UPI0002D71445|nr:MFS transporter [Paenisporosarcina sp. TG20]
MNQFTKIEKRRFWILVTIVSISGFSQGMLLPLISIIFEQDGVSSTLNGLNATGLYIGTILISPFMEQPLRRFGYKPIIIVGGILVFISLLLFPLWKSVAFWFVLRLIIGIGDHALHFSTQTWITSFSPQERLGRNIALYGLSFGIGFAVGPLFLPLVSIYEGLPFIVSGILCIFAWSLIFLVKNDFPGYMHSTSTMRGTWARFGATIGFAWVAFIPPFSYGFLESSLHAIFPVYALRNEVDVSMVSIILVAFSTGGIISQLPLGALSDRIGRKKVILLALFGGAFSFSGAALLEGNIWTLIGAFLIAGLFIGSSFSLGIAYMVDLTPKELLPTGNLLCGIFFSVGSLTGPLMGGFFLEYFEGFSFLWLVSLFLLTLSLISLLKPKKEHVQSI